MSQLFDNVMGFLSLRKQEEVPVEKEQLPSFAAPENRDAATEIEVQNQHGHIVHNINMNPSVLNTKDRINTYRKTAQIPEVSKGVEEIVNQAIVSQVDTDNIVDINLEKTKFSKGIQEKIIEEFQVILGLYNFDRRGEEIFKDWYVDSRIAYHKIYDPEKREEGLKELRRLDARFLDKVRVIEKGVTPNNVQVVVGTKEFFSYKPEHGDSRYSIGVTGREIKIPISAIVFSHSGLYDCDKKNIISYLDKAIKPANALKMLEDSAVIYRLARAPERRVFYVDVGNMPKAKAEQYVKNIQARFKDKIVYDSTTGKLKNKNDTQSILEDYWLPRREGGKATEISTLPGSANLGQIEELRYYKRNLYESLNVPYARFDIENEGGGSFDLGRASETTRDEMSFNRFTNKLQRKFGDVLTEPLKTQLILKKIITPLEWEANKNWIKLIFNTDTYYEELKETEIMQGRLDLLSSMEDYIGKYFSHQDVMDKVLKQTKDEQKKTQKEIEVEKREERFRESSDF